MGGCANTVETIYIFLQFWQFFLYELEYIENCTLVKQCV